jgi:hypothetical protein
MMFFLTGLVLAFAADTYAGMTYFPVCPVGEAVSVTGTFSAANKSGACLVKKMSLPDSDPKAYHLVANGDKWDVAIKAKKSNIPTLAPVKLMSNAKVSMKWGISNLEGLFLGRPEVKDAIKKTCSSIGDPQTFTVLGHKLSGLPTGVVSCQTPPKKPIKCDCAVYKSGAVAGGMQGSLMKILNSICEDGHCGSLNVNVTYDCNFEVECSLKEAYSCPSGGKLEYVANWSANEDGSTNNACILGSFKRQAIKSVTSADQYEFIPGKGVYLAPKWVDVGVKCTGSDCDEKK